VTKPAFVWDGFGAGHAYPKGLAQLFVGDFDGSSPLRAASRQLFEEKLDLTRQNARSSLISGFVTRKGTKSASQTLSV
jgi:hypothetical protein